ncbi:MAG: hypothetical protein M1324_03575 [Patescibacteria group bacterium]|nr:hypothetical protein [Patescibacteria group bacterium]
MTIRLTSKVWESILIEERPRQKRGGVVLECLSRASLWAVLFFITIDWNQLAIITLWGFAACYSFVVFLLDYDVEED